MTIRTTETTVTFDHPFRLSGADGLLPAGTYRVVMDEEPILGLSFLAHRRTATMLHTPALSAPQGRSSSLSTDQPELDRALAKDRQQTAVHPDAPSPGAANRPARS
ncbi:hypothetical protein [Aquabacter cavernae]|uniref:hypothetical protein n=1 Tax=Aquabacter cavernae TaxID=2496029 RepID=UPI000F8CF9E9|nr:hypothetical protein [Aquabacter cavernae]